MVWLISPACGSSLHLDESSLIVQQRNCARRSAMQNLAEEYGVRSNIRLADQPAFEKRGDSIEDGSVDVRAFKIVDAIKLVRVLYTEPFCETLLITRQQIDGKRSSRSDQRMGSGGAINYHKNRGRLCRYAGNSRGCHPMMLAIAIRRHDRDAGSEFSHGGPEIIRAHYSRRGRK